VRRGLLRPARCQAFVADPKIYDHLSAGTYLFEPEGFIYFAGEHTTLNHAWIESAIESGIRAARALFERFEHENVVDLTQDFAR
jgi:Flavin containing amine oxidoreductase